jgi:hypothetical protein
VTRSHSAGAGAAAVAPDGWRIGVDVMRLDRVTARHASAVADDGEIATIASAVGARRAPAVIWALKEAAMKATARAGLGTMRQWVLHRTARDGSTELHYRRSRRGRVEAGWRIDGDFVCAWAIIPPRDMALARPLPPSAT